MKYLLASLLLLYTSSSCFCDELSNKMKTFGLIEFLTADIGKIESPWKNPTYIVENNGSLSIRNPPVEELRAKKKDMIVETKNVTYIGINLGEWGGGLYLDKYEKDKKPFLKGNIKALIPIGDDLYIFEGSASDNISRGGAIYAIRDYETPSEPERVTLLPDEPMAFLVPDGISVGKTIYYSESIIIVGSGSFMIFNPDSYLNVMYSDAFWSGCNPSSIVKCKGYYLIGTDRGVAAVPSQFYKGDTLRFRFFTKNEMGSNFKRTPLKEKTVTTSE